MHGTDLVPCSPPTLLQESCTMHANAGAPPSKASAQVRKLDSQILLDKPLEEPKGWLGCAWQNPERDVTNAATTFDYLIHELEPTVKPKSDKQDNLNL
jgi:hypothetical protein